MGVVSCHGFCDSDCAGVPVDSKIITYRTDAGYESEESGEILVLNRCAPAQEELIERIEQTAKSDAGRYVTICQLGTKCKCREEEHLATVAHPLDPGYADFCQAAGQEPEEPSLRGLFDWIDHDGTGKLSRQELVLAGPLLSRLEGQEVIISDHAWERLDEDGNNAVNFNEFAEWAGPRLGLPLGVKKLFEKSSDGEYHGCAIINCPCEVYRPKSKQPALVKELSRKFSGFLKSDLGKDRLQLCCCGHKHSSHNMGWVNEGEVPCPLYWDHRDTTQNDFNELIPVDPSSLILFQKLFDDTYRKIWTRDRKKHNPDNPLVPRGYKVLRAFRSENSLSWREYTMCRANLIQDTESAPEGSLTVYDVKSTEAWVKHGDRLADRLKRNCNEWYLFHGTSAANAKVICRDDFKCSVAGKNTGTLYGRGVYMSESITKADEYATPDAKKEYTVLLCRAMGGHAKYTAEVEPEPEELVRDCLEGPYDCIIGDREKCRGTFREFVFYDTENVFAEYMIQYKRLM